MVVDPRQPDRIARTIARAGTPVRTASTSTLPPHRLFCACDAGVLVTLDAALGQGLDEKPLSGVPDVVFFNRQRQHLYVAVGDPGVIDVFSTASMARLATHRDRAGRPHHGIVAGRRLALRLPAAERIARPSTRWQTHERPRAARPVARRHRPADGLRGLGWPRSRRRSWRRTAARVAPPACRPACSRRVVPRQGRRAAGRRGAVTAIKVNGNFPGNPAANGLPTVQGVIYLADGHERPAARGDGLHRGHDQPHGRRHRRSRRRHLARHDPGRHRLRRRRVQGRIQLVAIAAAATPGARSTYGTRGAEMAERLAGEMSSVLQARYPRRADLVGGPRERHHRHLHIGAPAPSRRLTW